MAMSDDGTQWTKPYEGRWALRLMVRSSRFFAIASFGYAVATVLLEGFSLDLLPWILGAVAFGVLLWRARWTGLWVSDVGIKLVHPVYERTFEWSSLQSVEVVSMPWVIGEAHYLQLELKDGRKSHVPWLNTSWGLAFGKSQLHRLAAHLQQRIDGS